MKRIVVCALTMYLLADPTGATANAAVAEVKELGVDMTQPLPTDGSAAVPIFKDNLTRSETENKTNPNCTGCADLTLGHACAFALRFSTLADPEFQASLAHPIPPTAAIDKALREELANRIADDKDAHLSAHEIETIKSALNLAPFPGSLMLAILPRIDPAGWENALKAAAKK